MKIKVLLEPNLALHKDGFILTSACIIRVDDEVYTVPEGFVTDLASVPRFLRPVIDNDEKGIRLAAILHDAMYRGVCWVEGGKSQADRIFRELCIYRGLPTWKAYSAWVGVMIGGSKFWVPLPAPRTDYKALTDLSRRALHSNL